MYMAAVQALERQHDNREMDLGRGHDSTYAEPLVFSMQCSDRLNPGQYAPTQNPQEKSVAAVASEVLVIRWSAICHLVPAKVVDFIVRQTSGYVQRAIQGNMHSMTLSGWIWHVARQHASLEWDVLR